MKHGLKDGHNKKTRREVAASRRQREKEEGEEFKEVKETGEKGEKKVQGWEEEEREVEE